MTSDDLIDKAKSVISDHERLAAEGDISKIEANFSDDVVLLAGNAPLVEGIESFRSFYSGLISMGKWSFRHDYHGADVVGDSALLYGVAHGSLVTPDGNEDNFENNFIIIVREAGGSAKIWRAAFAPAS